MPIKLNIYNQTGEKVSEIEAPDKIFGLKANVSLVHQAYVTQISNERQVLAHTKGRSEVRGGGRKPWRQKGTGRARVGSTRSPLWIGGGVTFGPTNNRNFKKKINKKMKQQALCMVLSDKLANNNFVVINNFDLTEFKTKAVSSILNKVEEKALGIKRAKKVKAEKRSLLLINSIKDDKYKYSARNLVGVKNINLENINIVDLLNYKNIVITEASIKKLSELYKNEK